MNRNVSRNWPQKSIRINCALMYMFTLCLAKNCDKRVTFNVLLGVMRTSSCRINNEAATEVFINANQWLMRCWPFQHSTAEPMTFQKRDWWTDDFIYKSMCSWLCRNLAITENFVYFKVIPIGFLKFNVGLIGVMLCKLVKQRWLQLVSVNHDCNMWSGTRLHASHISVRCIFLIFFFAENNNWLISTTSVVMLAAKRI